MEQMSIFDILSLPVDEIPCGHTENMAVVGRKLYFTELAGMIGKKVVVSSGEYYKVVKIIEYHKDSDRIYKQVRKLPDDVLQYAERINDYIYDCVGQRKAMACYELETTCDRVGYADKEKLSVSNCWESEMYCNNGRYKPLNDIADTFYELNMV